MINFKGLLPIRNYIVRKFKKKKVVIDTHIPLKSPSENFVEDYTRIPNIWVPYVMKLSAPNFNSSSASTDENGMRNTIFHGKKVEYSEYLKSEVPHSLLLGNSMSFGVGTSNDSMHVSSMLSKYFAHPWYNLSGRAFNQTQEILALVLYGRFKHNYITQISGINNLLFHLYFEDSGNVFPFWGQHEYEQVLNPNIIKQAGGFSEEEKFNKIIKIIDRDFFTLKNITENNSNKVLYVLQPFLAWSVKELHRNEVLALEKLALSKNRLHFYHRPENIKSWQQKYTSAIEKLCFNYGIEFLDMNTSPYLETKEQIFIDGIHLNDYGHGKLAEAIFSKLNTENIN